MALGKMLMYNKPNDNRIVKFNEGGETSASVHSCP